MILAGVIVYESFNINFRHSIIFKTFLHHPVFKKIRYFTAVVSLLNVLFYYILPLYTSECHASR